MGLIDFLSKPLHPESGDPEDQEYLNFLEQWGVTDADNPLSYYDYKSAFAAGATPDERGKWPSKFKDDLHPRRYQVNKDDLSIHDTKYDTPAELEDMVMQALRRKEYER